MVLRVPLRRLATDRRGNVAILAGLGMTMMIGAAALAVDVGSLSLDHRKLQGIADAAALAAAAKPGEERTSALRVITANCDCGIWIDTLTTGSYLRDPDVNPDDRFQPGTAAVDAVRVVIKRRHPLYFGRFLTGSTTREITASAIGARQGYAAFSLGSRVAGVNGGVANALLSGLTGSELNLTAADYRSLASANVDLLSFSNALRANIGSDALTYGQTLSTNVTLRQAISALAACSSGPESRLLAKIADRAPNSQVLPRQIINLGPRADDVSIDAADPVQVNVLTLLRALLILGNEDRLIDLDVTSELPGGGSAKLWLAVGSPMAHSPLIAISNDQKVILRSSQVRLYLDTQLISPLAKVKLPIVVEMGAAAARITSINCNPTVDAKAVTLGVTTSPATLGIGTINLSEFQDVGRPLMLTPAQLVTLPLVHISGESEVILSDDNEKLVGFSRPEIADLTLKTVSSSGAVQGVVSSLVDRMSLSVKVIGLDAGVPAGTVKSGATDAILAAAPALDKIIDQAMDTLGVHIGQADTRVDALQCGRAFLAG